MSETAADAYDLRVRLGRFLPTPLVVVLALIRNFSLGLFTLADSQVAPEWIVVTRKTDGAAVARVYAGREFRNGEDLLAAMSRTLGELGPVEFLETWHATRV